MREIESTALFFATLRVSSQVSRERTCFSMSESTSSTTRRKSLATFLLRRRIEVVSTRFSAFLRSLTMKTRRAMTEARINRDPTPKTTQKTMSKMGEEMMFVPLSSVMRVTAAAAMPEMRSEIFFPSMMLFLLG